MIAPRLYKAPVRQTHPWASGPRPKPVLTSIPVKSYLGDGGPATPGRGCCRQNCDGEWAVQPSRLLKPDQNRSDLEADGPRAFAQVLRHAKKAKRAGINLTCVLCGVTPIHSDLRAAKPFPGDVTEKILARNSRHAGWLSFRYRRISHRTDDRRPPAVDPLCTFRSR